MKLEYSGSGGSSCTEVVLSLIILFCESDLSTLAIIAVYFSIDDLLSKVIKILLKSFNQCDQCSSLVKLTWFGLGPNVLHCQYTIHLVLVLIGAY